MARHLCRSTGRSCLSLYSKRKSVLVIWPNIEVVALKQELAVRNAENIVTYIASIYASNSTTHFNIGSLMETGIHLNGNGQAPVQKYWEELLVLIQQEKICP
jgi:hypothetical protein